MTSFISTHSFIEHAVLPAGSITVAAHLQSWPFPGTTHFLGEGIEKKLTRNTPHGCKCIMHDIWSCILYAICKLNYISKRVDAMRLSEFISCI